MNENEVREFETLEEVNTYLKSIGCKEVGNNSPEEQAVIDEINAVRARGEWVGQDLIKKLMNAKNLSKS